MLGVYSHISSLFSDKKISYKAGDINTSVILMWKKVQKGWKVPTEFISEEKYNQLKVSKDSAIKGYVGHQYSFAGQYFKGYAPMYGKKFDTKKVRDRINDIGKNVKNVKFSSGSYTQFSNLKGYVIYCDPPYINSYSKYDGDFDHDDFVNWCLKMSLNNIIFVSEYKKPSSDFQLIWSKKLKTTGNITQDKGKVRDRTERLFYL